MTPAARFSAAVALLAEMESQGRRPADAIANDFFRARRYIGSGDRRAVADRAWGVVRERMLLDWHLARAGGASTPRLLVAAHARLVEGEEPRDIAWIFSGERFAEPVLTQEETRVVASLRPPLRPPGLPETVRLNVPDWALPGFRARFGDDVEPAARAMTAPAPLDLRVNLLRGTREAAQLSLHAEGIAAEPTPFSPWGLRVADRRPVLATEAFRTGLIEVQDEGSQLIALLADARPGMRVADYCAGAAGKTLAMAATMANRGRITACDVSQPRLTGASKRLRRAGVDNAELHLLTAGDRWVKRRAATFDRVLVDAPCTGTGTWRRNPDARLRMGPTDLDELRRKQSEILETASSLVRPGGRLIYATCSVLPEEDEGQVETLLQRRPEFRIVPLAQAWAQAIAESGAASGAEAAAAPPGEGPHMALSPHRHDTDGFFCAVLERR